MATPPPCSETEKKSVCHINNLEPILLSNSSSLPHCIETTTYSKPFLASPLSPLVEPAVLPTIAAAATEEESSTHPCSSIFKDPDSSNSSSTPTILSASAATSGVKFLGGERRKGRKYYLSGSVNNKIFHQIVDTGAVSSLGMWFSVLVWRKSP